MSDGRMFCLEYSMTSNSTTTYTQIQNVMYSEKTKPYLKRLE